MKALARLHLAVLGVAITFASTPAYAQSQGMLDNVLNKYKSMAAAWGSVFITHASFLFGGLAAISLIWTFGQMALRRADLGEFASETLRFAIFCGTFWYLLINGPAIGIAIINGLRQLGAQASGLPDNLAPSGIVDIGFDIFRQVIAGTSLLQPVDSAMEMLIGLGILITLALIGVNMLLLLASGYILAYGGVIFLGFGGSRWTSDIALNYFKTVVAVGASLMTMVLIVGVGKTFLDQYYAQTGSGASIQDLATMLVFAIVLLALTNKVPAMVGGIISGGSIHAAGHIGNFGAGAAIGAASMAAGAMATGGAMMAAGAAEAAGGASAIRAAFTAAGAGGGEGGGAGDGKPLSAAGDTGGGGDNGGGGGAVERLLARLWAATAMLRTRHLQMTMQAGRAVPKSPVVAMEVARLRLRLKNLPPRARTAQRVQLARVKVAALPCPTQKGARVPMAIAPPLRMGMVPPGVAAPKDSSHPWRSCCRYGQAGCEQQGRKHGWRSYGRQYPRCFGCGPLGKRWPHTRDRRSRFRQSG
jgi:type IV secretion system protein TrbL